jgi:hypothetical protein
MIFLLAADVIIRISYNREANRRFGYKKVTLLQDKIKPNRSLWLFRLRKRGTNTGNFWAILIVVISDGINAAYLPGER